jgi:GntR family transcriptional regulator
MNELATKPDGNLRDFRLDPRSQLPLHARAEQAVRDLIAKPDYRDGGLLPDEVSLARWLGISRNTLRAAIGRLVDEGRLERRAGVGTRVVEPPVSSGVGAWHSFTKEMLAQGIVVETFAIGIRRVAAPADVARALQLTSGAQVLRLDRVRGWAGKPEVVFRSWLHPRLGLSEQDNFTAPLYALIRSKCSIVADESVEHLTAVAADARLAEKLNVRAGTPLLRRVRTVLDAGRRPIEYAMVHYRCERFALSLTLRHE